MVKNPNFIEQSFVVSSRTLNWRHVFQVAPTYFIILQTKEPNAFLKIVLQINTDQAIVFINHLHKGDRILILRKTSKPIFQVKTFENMHSTSVDLQC